VYTEKWGWVLLSFYLREEELKNWKISTYKKADEYNWRVILGT